MPSEKEMSQRNMILKIITGSHLYGTSLPTSDLDYSGIFIADDDYYFGLRSVDEVDNSSVSKNAAGKNDADAVDDKLYEIRKFARLAMQNNPNLCEHLFANEKNIVFVNEFGRMLLDNRHLFPYKGAYNKFVGYAMGQRHKMIIKEKNFTGLSDALEYFDSQEPHAMLVEYKEKGLTFLTEDQTHFMIGDLNFQKHVKVKKVLEILRDRMSKISSRYELVTKYGFDVKFGSHLIRLLLEGEELLKTGEIKFPLSYAPLLLEIKQGKYTAEQILKMSEDLESRMKDAKETSKLPDNPNFEGINALVMSITKQFHKDGIIK